MKQSDLIMKHNVQTRTWVGKNLLRKLFYLNELSGIWGGGILGMLIALKVVRQKVKIMELCLKA